MATPYQAEASVWQDGNRSAKIKLHCHVQLDTQHEKSNWVSARLVDDLEAATTALRYPQSYTFADGKIITANLETTLTFRLDGQTSVAPRTRFFVAAETGVSFDIILGWEDSKYSTLLSPKFNERAAHQVQKGSRTGVSPFEICRVSRSYRSPVPYKLEAVVTTRLWVMKSIDRD